MEAIMAKLNFIPIIVGTDINAYNMSISFHEEYDVNPILVGRGELPFTKFSTIPGKIEYFPKLGDPAEFPKIMEKVAKKYGKSGKKLMLVGTNDMYVRYIVEHAEFLKKYFVFNYPTIDVMDKLQYKAQFYQLCEEYGIDYPVTRFYDCTTIDAPFNDNKILYPLILKPSNVILYLDLKFEGKEKVYKAETEEEVNRILNLLHDAGYHDEIIIQEFIPGDDTLMWDGVVYADQHKNVQLVALGQVVLQEHTPTAIGNYTSIISRFDKELMRKMQDFIEYIGYTGFANFDLKYDTRDGKFKVFEINIRQGRSSYYVTRLGHNLARYLVDDCVNNEKKDVVYANGEFLFSVVPKKVLRDFVDNNEINAECRRLIKEGKWANPLFYPKDKSFKRKLYMAARQYNYYQKYKNNQW